MFDPIEWLNEHPEMWEQYQNKWVALDPTGICISGDKAEDIFTKAPPQIDLYIFKVPSRDRIYFY